MRHREALELLPDWLAGRVRPASRSQMRAHLDSCKECREYLEVYRMFAETLVGDAEAASWKHPTSDALARYVGDPAGESEEIRAHLEHCRSCRREVDLSRAALRSSRGSRSGTWATIAANVDRPHGRMVLAAAVVLVVLTTALLLSPARRGDTPTYELSGRRLGGEQVIAARGALRATAVEIESGSTIAFRAGEMVSLGEGFVVGSDSDFSVEITGASPRSPEDHQSIADKGDKQ